MAKCDRTNMIDAERAVERLLPHAMSLRGSNSLMCFAMPLRPGTRSTRRKN